jgi:hypothetical protein
MDQYGLPIPTSVNRTFAGALNFLLTTSEVIPNPGLNRTDTALSRGTTD